MFYKPFLFSLSFSFYSFFWGAFTTKKFHLENAQRKCFSCPFFLQLYTECSPHTRLQSDQNGVWDSFTSHQQHNSALFWLKFSDYNIRSKPFPTSTRVQALNSDVRV